MRMSRRSFIRSTVAGASGIVVGVQAFGAAGQTSLDGTKKITRKLGRTGLELPVVSMGVMRSDNPALVRAALQKGFVHFDTAHGYQNGKNEEMLGEVFQNVPRKSIIIGTKVQPEDRNRMTGVIGPNSTSKAFLARLETSLRRLRTDYVDILYVHAVSSRPGVLHPEMLEAVTAAKAAGKARFVGVSTHKNEPEVIRAAVESGLYDVVLTAVNFKQDHYAEVKTAMAEAVAAGVGLVGMKTMAGGFLDKEKTKPINCRAALKFVLQDPHLCTTIPGISSFDQLDDNAAVNEDIALTEQEKADLEQASLQGGLYCQGCEHCAKGCSRGLPIPDLMRAYMYAYGYGSTRDARTVLEGHGITGSPCENCDTCGAECVKGFTVRDRIADVARISGLPAEFLA